WHTSLKHDRSSNLRPHSGSCALVRNEQLALADDSGRSSRHHFWRSHLFRLAKSSGRSKIPQRKRKRLAHGPVECRRKGKARSKPYLSGRSVGSRSCVAFGVDRFATWRRRERSVLLDAAHREGAVEQLLQ